MEGSRVSSEQLDLKLTRYSFSLCCVLDRNIQFFLTIHSGVIMRILSCGVNSLETWPVLISLEDFLTQKRIRVANVSQIVEFNLTKL